MADTSAIGDNSAAGLAGVNLHTLLDKLSDPIILVDRGRKVLFANSAALDVVDALRIGKDLAISWRHPAALEAVDACLTSGEQQTAEVKLSAPVNRTLQLETIPVDDDGSGLSRAMVVLRDVTSARSADQVRQDFVANVSHELRSPIASLVGFIETLQGPAKNDPDAQERFLAIMEEEAARMSRLVDELLSLSRVEVSEHVLPRDRVHVPNLLGMTKELLDGRAAEKEMEIKVDLLDGLPLVLGEQDELMEVFQNLIDNAIKYGHRETPITVEAWKIDRIAETKVPGVAISINSKGDVIGPEHLPRLTERFYRVDKGRSRKLGGTGLGLAIVKHIVSRHRGRLAIESNAEEGTTFTIQLPAPE
jgi:two-component system phosphate regulon sensor histidine kinase PhoR